MPAQLPARVRAVVETDLMATRDDLGLHEYDGTIQDLSPSGVHDALTRIGVGDAPTDEFDRAVLDVHECRVRTWYGEQQVHRWSAQLHLQAMDLSGYGRAYAPLEQREEAVARARALIPQAVDNAITSLDQLGKPGAHAALQTATAMQGEAVKPAEKAAFARLIDHLRTASRDGGTGALGPERFTALINSAEGTDLGVDDLLDVCDAEGQLATRMLTEATAWLRPGVDVGVAVSELLAMEDVGAGQVLARSRRLVAELTAFIEGAELLIRHDSECAVEQAPMSSATSQASMLWNGPFEPPAPSVFQIVLPTSDIDESDSREWLRVFGDMTLPAIAAHEVVPGHFSHAQALRRVSSSTRRALLSPAFVEGWAHLGEELCVDHGFRGNDPRFRLGVALEALLRVTRLRGLLRFHCVGATLGELTGMFEEEAFLARRSAEGEAFRVVVDPMCGGYTLGKAALRAARDRQRDRTRMAASDRAFHDRLLALGAPPLGLLAMLPTPAGS